MKRIPPKAQRGSSRFSLDKQPKTPHKTAAPNERRPAEYVLLNKQRKHAINRVAIHRFLSTLVPELGIEGRAFTVVFIHDDAMRRYNSRYRGYDKPTDVLSFGGDHLYLGDILISSETAYNQSRKSANLSFETNLRRLIVHGLLHLMGYDHETDDGEMRRIERRLRRRFEC